MIRQDGANAEDECGADGSPRAGANKQINMSSMFGEHRSSRSIHNDSVLRNKGDGHKRNLTVGFNSSMT